MKTNIIYNTDAIEGLKNLPDKCIQTCVTSPPYYGLRDYGTATWVGGDEGCDHSPQRPDGGERKDRALILGRGGAYKSICAKCGAIRQDKQIGLEETPEEYVDKLVQLFREVRRVLRDDGTLWLNLGDSYAGNCSVASNGGRAGFGNPREKVASRTFDNIKPKDLIGIPWMVAFALRADGWYLRQDIIWHKPNPMPESVTDRCTKAHEYIFLFSKSPRYYYDNEAVKESATTNGDRPTLEQRYANGEPTRHGLMGADACGAGGFGVDSLGKKNKRSVWTVTTKPFSEAHFAVFPQDLIEPCILAGCPEDGIVLDPFMGSGTTAITALKHRRRFIGFELNPEYVKIAEKRIKDNPGPPLKKITEWFA